MRQVIENKSTKSVTKSRNLKIYVESIFLYNGDNSIILLVDHLSKI